MFVYKIIKFSKIISIVFTLTKSIYKRITNSKDKITAMWEYLPNIKGKTRTKFLKFKSVERNTKYITFFFKSGNAAYRRMKKKLNFFRTIAYTPVSKNATAGVYPCRTASVLRLRKGSFIFKQVTNNWYTFISLNYMENFKI